MRRIMKNKIKEVLQSLHEAHVSAANSYRENASDQAYGILADCQDTAVQLADIIENLEGAGSTVVAHLSDYCEALYQATLSQKNDFCQVLDSILYTVEECVNNDIPNTTEIVFMPYKASMWDSLESVWRAASNDPACDVYVVPIPYYDRNPDGSLGAFHYDGSEFPADIPVIHYDDYDLEERRPDAIYIHNPYDDANFVTTVDPRFYSAELKKYTEKLVYIPYFVLGESDADDTEKLSRFVLMPGVLNADRVVVQSDRMRKAYIDILQSRMPNTPKSREIIEKKVLGIGSPKFDSVSYATADIPSEWTRILTKPNGERKRVVLYNTGITSLLENNELMLKKMIDVLEIFRKKSDDIALLWRPHPLIMATLESMRPELLRAYLTIVKKFRMDGWGIYDDTSDLGRAINLCDAYYGDKSSVVQLVRKAGKPVLIQSI